MNQLQNRY